MDEFEKKSIDVDLLGQSIRIRHEDEKYVRKLEKLINKKLEIVQKGGSMTSLQAAVRVLLVLADDYLSVKRKQEDDLKSVDDRARKMIELIDHKSAL